MILSIQWCWIIDQETFGKVFPMFLLIFGIPQSCFVAARIWCQIKIGFEDPKRYRETITRVSRDVGNNQTQPGLCWSKVKDVIDDTTIHRRARMIILTMNLIDNLEQ